MDSSVGCHATEQEDQKITVDLGILKPAWWTEDSSLEAYNYYGWVEVWLYEVKYHTTLVFQWTGPGPPLRECFEKHSILKIAIFSTIVQLWFFLIDLWHSEYSVNCILSVF